MRHGARGRRESERSSERSGFGVVADADRVLLLRVADQQEPVPAQDAWAEDLTLAEGIDRFQQFVVHPITRITSNWAGLRTFAPDRSLVIGPAKENHNFFWFGGQGGYGFQTAAATSELAKELILNQPTSLPKNIVRALSPDRFS